MIERLWKYRHMLQLMPLECWHIIGGMKHQQSPSFSYIIFIYIKFICTEKERMLDSYLSIIGVNFYFMSYNFLNNAVIFCWNTLLSSILRRSFILILLYAQKQLSRVPGHFPRMLLLHFLGFTIMRGVTCGDLMV